MKGDFKAWLVKWLPKWVIYYAVIRAGVHATTGKWANTITPEVTIIEVMERWAEQSKPL